MSAEKLPAGLYDLLLTTRERERLDVERSMTRPLESSEVARLAALLQQQLALALEDLQTGDSLVAQLGLVNDLLVALGTRLPDAQQAIIDPIAEPATILTSISRHGRHALSPDTGLSAPWLFTAGKGTPSLLSELRRELAAAEQVDILVSFITVSGVRKLRDVLQVATAVGADGRPPLRIRVLTTTYIGATQTAAVHELARLPGCEVRISLDGRRTRLHAKAWIFHRASGFGSAYVGSANLTGAALAGGLEWTIKMTQRAQTDVYTRAIAHFDTLWEDPEFQHYDPDDPSHRVALDRALGKESFGTPRLQEAFFDIRPRIYQQEMLEQLAQERRHGRSRNLVIAATGTGKTVVAALDYARTCQEQGHRPRLLFVAHRRMILQQALQTYRQVLRDGSFGQLLDGFTQPDGYDWVFATINTVASRDLVAQLGADHWHTVVIDECHRIAGDRFNAFATSVTPSILLGLTATPERTDGKSILRYFDSRADGSPAVELRLWTALELQLLAPFEYYACDDETDFSQVPWNRVGEQQAVVNLVSNNDVRARTVVREWHRLAEDPRLSRALVFCVSVAHAQFMAKFLSDAGLPAVCLAGDTPPRERERARKRLESGELCALVTVDLFNEGIDIPTVDTLLLLRPTQSSVVFQQQLGRGLRLHPSKESCLVLDFVGQHNAEFRYDRLLSSITGQTRRQVLDSLDHGFSTLPAGCHIHLDQQVRTRVLANLRRQVQQQWRSLSRELSALAALRGRNPTLSAFIHEQGVALEDIYRPSGKRGWSVLQRDAGLLVAEEGSEERYLSERFSLLCHRDTPGQVDALRTAACHARSGEPVGAADGHLLQMLAYQVDGTHERVGSAQDFVDRLASNPATIRELEELADALEVQVVLPERPLPGLEHSGLALGGSYEQREILTAVGWLTATRRTPFQAGVLALHEQRIELLMVTLDKSSGYHDAINYHDYAISPSRFHWQTQNSAGPDTPVGQRYLQSPGNGWQFQLFVRADRSSAYVACGPVTLVKCSGDRPMDIIWELAHPLGAARFRGFSVLRGA